MLPVTQLETSLSSMTTLLVRRHGTHVPFHPVAAWLLSALPLWNDGAVKGVNAWQELLRAPH